MTLWLIVRTAEIYFKKKYAFAVIRSHIYNYKPIKIFVNREVIHS